MHHQWKRREVITLLGGVAVWPLTARAQQSERMRRIGMLLSATADDAVFQAWVGARPLSDYSDEELSAIIAAAQPAPPEAAREDEQLPPDPKKVN